MKTYRIAFIALGANLGNREETLKIALKRLQDEGLQLVGVSDFYETAPVGYLNQADFINAVAAFELPQNLSSIELMKKLLAIEAQLGRVRSFCNAPRTCDLDLLFVDDEKSKSEFLVLPHPRWRERAFVVVPLKNLLEKTETAPWRQEKTWIKLTEELANIEKIIDKNGVKLFLKIE